MLVYFNSLLGEFIPLKVLGKGISVGRILAHGVVGGAAAKAQGGHFASGFISSAFTKSVSGYIQAATNFDPAAGAITAAVVGGTASVLAGGTFANGAVTSAFQYVYNQHSRKRLSRKDWKNLGKVASAYLRGLRAIEDRDLMKSFNATTVSEMAVFRLEIIQQLRAVAINGIRVEAFEAIDGYIDTFLLSTIVKSLPSGKFGTYGEISLALYSAKGDIQAGQTIRGWYTGDRDSGYGVLCGADASCGFITPNGYYKYDEI